MADPGPPRDFIGYGNRVVEGRWPNGARLAVSFVLNFEEGAERNVSDGDTVGEATGEMHYPFGGKGRDLSTESTYEYGSRVGIWRLLNIFDEYHVKMTAFVCGLALLRNPEVGAALRAAGHEPCGHGHRWVEAWRLTANEERRDLRQAIDAIGTTCGERPVGWYNRYAPSERTRELLVEEGGFLYDSNAYNDDAPYFVQTSRGKHLVLPYTHTYNDGRFLASPTYASPSDFVDNCARGIRQLWAEGDRTPRMISIGLHSRIVGQAGRATALREIIECALGLEDVWIARRVDIAKAWLDLSGERNPLDGITTRR